MIVFAEIVFRIFLYLSCQHNRSYEDISTKKSWQEKNMLDAFCFGHFGFEEHESAQLLVPLAVTHPYCDNAEGLPQALQLCSIK